MDRDKAYYWGRRLHSLTGVMPVGAFLVQHIYGNALAMWGSEAYDEHVQGLIEMPMVIALEIGVIFLPLMLHSVLGLLYTFNSKNNVMHYGYQRNWMYWAQRVTGLITLAYIIIHVATTRLSFSEDQKMNMYATMHQYFQDMTWMVPLYIVGVLAACFHFCNGLWSFCIMWGITITRKSQRMVFRAAMGLFVILAIGGIWSSIKLWKDPPTHTPAAAHEPVADHTAP